MTDLHSFIMHFEPAIRLSVSHLYISALTWISSNSRIMSVSPRTISPKLKVSFERLAEPAKDATRIDSDNRVYFAVRSPDGSRIVSGNNDRTLSTWDGWTGQRIVGPIKGHTGDIIDAAFSPDGTQFASGSDDKKVKIWDTQTGELVKEMKSKSEVCTVVFSLDGCRVVSGHDDGKWRVWDTQNGILVSESRNRHSNNLSSVAISPDGRRIASGSSDDTLMIWDAKSGSAIGEPLRGHKDSVNSVAYSPDGDRVISGSDDRTVWVWDAHTGMPIGEPLKGHEGWVVDAGYSRDGNTIISASRDGTIRFWDATDGTPIGVLHRGESRWDTERQHFVSLPRWWPGFAVTVRTRSKSFIYSPDVRSAIIYSANPPYIPDDGWIRSFDGSPLLWVPPEHRDCSCHAALESTLTTNIHDERLKSSAWKNIHRGWDWAEMMMDMQGLDRD